MHLIHASPLLTFNTIPHNSLIPLSLSLPPPPTPFQPRVKCSFGMGRRRCAIGCHVRTHGNRDRTRCVDRHVPCGWRLCMRSHRVMYTASTTRTLQLHERRRGGGYTVPQLFCDCVQLGVFRGFSGIQSHHCQWWQCGGEDRGQMLCDV